MGVEFKIEKLFSHRMIGIEDSITLELNKIAKALPKIDGKPVINMAVGELPYKTPEHIIRYAFAAAMAGQTCYTPVAGMSDLIAAICKKFEEENDLIYAPDQVIVGAGAKQVLFNAFFVTLNPGDEVILSVPYWISYPPMIRLSSGTPVPVETKLADGFKMTPEALEKAITPKTKWVVLNSPSNPTGAVYTRDELAALGEVLLRHPNVLIISDEIYEHLTYDGVHHESIAAVVPALQGRTLVVNGVSKAYSMTGWRNGFGAGPKALIDLMKKLQSHTTSNAASISQAAAFAALDFDSACKALESLDPDAASLVLNPNAALREIANKKFFLEAWRHELQAARDLVVDRIQNIEGLDCFSPPGAFYIFVSCEGLIGKVMPNGQTIKDEKDFCTYLLKECYLVAVPGGEFGAPGHFRLSFAMKPEVLWQACDRLQKACEALKPAQKMHKTFAP